jgi:hypothetical protein
MMAFYPVCVYLPSHFLFIRLFRKGGNPDSGS